MITGEANGQPPQNPLNVLFNALLQDVTKSSQTRRRERRRSSSPASGTVLVVAFWAGRFRPRVVWEVTALEGGVRGSKAADHFESVHDNNRLRIWEIGRFGSESLVDSTRRADLRSERRQENKKCKNAREERFTAFPLFFSGQCSERIMRKVTVVIHK